MQKNSSGSGVNSPTAKGWGAGWARRLSIGVAVAAVVLPLACACILVPMYYYQQQSGNRESALILGAALAAFLLLCMGAALALGARLYTRNRGRFDAAFAPLGVRGSAHLISGRQYHGSWQGRALDAYVYRGPAIDLYLGTPIKTRLAVGTRDALGASAAGLAGHTAMRTVDRAYDRLAVSALDEHWTMNLLSDPQARDALLRVMQPAGPSELRAVLFGPEYAELALRRTPPAAITAQNVSAWAADLLEVVRAAEVLPPPHVTAEAGTSERRQRADRDALALPAVALALLLIAIPTLCLLAAIFVIVQSGAR